MATYPVDIPALPPLASGADDNPAPANSHGDRLDDSHVAAAKTQHTGVPLWAVTMEQKLQLQINTLQDTLQSLQQQMQQNFQRVRREIKQESQRSMNRSRVHTYQQIEMVVRVDDGQMPNQQEPSIWFPKDQNELIDVAEHQISALLEFYGQDPGGTRTEKEDRLKEFLGVVL
jgi:hypothetical protein